MAEQSETGISWTDETWNPIRGCSRVSEGCRNCYAESVARRFSGEDKNGKPLAYHGLTNAHGRWNGVVRVVEEHMEDPIRWQRPRRIFVNSMSDLFHENLANEDIARVFSVMFEAKRHTFQVLTKRAERMADWFRWWRNSYVHPTLRDVVAPNIHLGVSVENQKAAEDRIPALLEVPAAVRFLSVEPLLGPVDLSEWLLYRCAGSAKRGGNLGLGCGWEGSAGDTTGDDFRCPDCGGETIPHAEYAGDNGCDPGIHWVIVGGESGQGARPMHPDWARQLRDQCTAAEVAFHFKQWGEWRAPLEGEGFTTLDGMAGTPPAFLVDLAGHCHCTRTAAGADAVPMIRVGKKHAGRELDGRTWDEFPREVSRG